jgi:ATP-dependent Clp protease ATP-binding subunit ClpA
MEMKQLNPPEIVDIPDLLWLRKAIDDNIVGQERARDEIIDGFAIAMAGLNPPKHPISTFLFLGPTGVGKTEIAKVVNQACYDRFRDKIRFQEEWVRRHAGNNAALQRFRMAPLVKVDCGKFAGSMSHGVIELLGSPPSYVGSDQIPIFSPLQFPNGIVRVLLLDELEKAFVDSRDAGAEMMGILMSVLDEARIQNNRGEEVNFTWTIIIATSNFGAREILAEAKQSPMGYRVNSNSKTSKGLGRVTAAAVERLNERIYQNMRNALQDPLKSPFKPELLNRFDRIVVFRFLTYKEYAVILDKQIALLNDWLAKEVGAMLIVTHKAKQWILENGIDFEYGVRSLERFLRRKVRDVLARFLLVGEIQPGDAMGIRLKGDRLEFWKSSAESPASDASPTLVLPSGLDTESEPE